jgi:hypothetical protein
MAMKRPSEQSEQIALARRLDCARPRILWAHVPNGGSRDSREVQKLRASGVKAGVPDVLVFTPTAKAPHGVALELKAEGMSYGALGDEQREWLSALAACGWATVVAFGCDDAVGQLKAMGYAL